MVSINVSELDSDLKEDVVTFLEAKLPVKSDKDGDVISFEDKSARSHVTSPEIRTYMKRFLHAKELKKQFRILSEDGSLTFVKQHIDKEDEEEEESEESKKKSVEKETTEK
jgi:uncharacterized protein YuzE